MAAGEIEDHRIQRTTSHKAACIGRNKWFVYVKGLILDKLVFRFVVRKKWEKKCTYSSFFKCLENVTSESCIGKVPLVTVMLATSFIVILLIIIQ